MSQKKLSLITGILYLSLIFIGPISILIIPELFMGQTDLVSYVSENLHLVKWWLVGDFAIILIEFFLSIFVFFLFKKLNTKLAVIASVSRLFMVIVMVVNVFPLLVLLSTSDLALLELAINIHNLGVYVWEVFFFIHVVVVGILFIQFTELKKFIGYTLIVGSFGYLLDAVLNLLTVNVDVLNMLSSLLLVVVVLGEVFLIYVLMANKIQIKKS